tara:strand:- start:1245 stop:1490 length:246 start_codon:yes stop_codon:yes gene_type:complete
MYQYADEDVALKNNKVLREVSKTTLSERAKSLINDMIRENNDIIYKSEIKREEEAQHYMRQAENEYQRDVMKHFNAGNRED